MFPEAGTNRLNQTSPPRKLPQLCAIPESVAPTLVLVLLLHWFTAPTAKAVAVAQSSLGGCAKAAKMGMSIKKQKDKIVGSTKRIFFMIISFESRWGNGNISTPFLMFYDSKLLINDLQITTNGAAGVSQILPKEDVKATSCKVLIYSCL